MMSDLRTWPENCFSSFRSEKQRPQTSTWQSTWCGPGWKTGLESLTRSWSGPTNWTACCFSGMVVMSMRVKNSIDLILAEKAPPVTSNATGGAVVDAEELAGDVPFCFFRIAFAGFNRQIERLSVGA